MDPQKLNCQFNSEISIVIFNLKKSLYHSCTYICMYVCTYVCTCMYDYVTKYVFMYACMCMYAEFYTGCFAGENARLR